MTDTDTLNNRYHLLEPLGSGGMAQVYRARDLMLERFVAIKVLRPDFSSDPEFQVRFRQEARAAANLSHPNIVTVHDFGFDQGQLFLVMEHVPGTNLKTMIEHLGRLKLEDAIPLIVQACSGLGYAHRAGLVHCDVKPHNLLVMPDQRLKVTDFGIARAIASIHPDEHHEVVWGSPLYFSPEQASGQAPSPASDVYSLGVVMYETLTGKPPFIAKTAETLAAMHRDMSPQPPSQLNPAITPDLEQIMMKILAKEPAARYRTADQLGRVLMTFGQTHKAPAVRLTTPQASQPDPASTLKLPTERAVFEPSPVRAPARNAREGTSPGVRREHPPVPAVVRARAGQMPQPLPAPQRAVTPDADDALDIDLISVVLGLLALASVGGVMVLWFFIYLRWTTPTL
jgi:serine/threonine-protein kinase